jgi:superoxide dismutase, Cu-Zn family
MSRSLRLLAGATGVLLVATGVAIAQQLTVDINRISDSGVGEKIGTATVSEGKGGVSFKVAVSGLPKGQRGFHVHEKGDCGPGMKDGKMKAGIAAGEHYDPDGKKSHKGPKGAGHKGDLPALTASAKGEVNQTVTAPRLKLADVQGRSLVIHEGGDNYSDNPESGGGKGRIACGVIPKG